MEKKIILLTGAIISIILISQQAVIAQNWVITGNNNTTPFSKLGTTNFIPVSLYTNNTERIRIDEAGKVGIGTSTR